jgi:hypothetical protein
MAESVMPESGGVGPDAIFSALSTQITDLGREIGGLRQEIGDVKGTVGEVKATQERVEEDVGEIREALHGNGHKGLKGRVDVLEAKTKGMPSPSETSVRLISQNHNGGLKAKWQAIEKISSKIFKILILIIAAKYGYNEFVIGDTKVSIEKEKPTPAKVDNGAEAITNN